MTAQQQYTEHLLALKRAEIVSELEQQGYSVESEARVDNEQADLVARKPGGKTVLYEFKLPSSLHTSSDQIQRLRRTAAENGFEFKLVVVTPPKRIDVTVDGLERGLYNSFLERLDSTDLSSLASHVMVEDVSDIEISALKVHGKLTDVAGHGVVGVCLEYGGGEERDGVTSYDTYPFEFDIALNSHREIAEIRTLEVDTSSFYD